MDYFTMMLLIILAVFVYGGFRDYGKRKKRRASLRQDAATGFWIWMEMDGIERQSPIHPDAPGGVWSGDSASADSGDDGGD